MLENRPVVVIAIGYIIGIIVGLYCKISIVPIFLILYLLYLICKKQHKTKFKLISYKRYLRYVNIIITKKVIFILIAISIISNTIVLYKENQINSIYNKYDNIQIVAKLKIISNLEETNYKNRYKAKIIKCNNKILNSKNVYIYFKKDNKYIIEYGDEIQLTGLFTKPETQRNYKGFDYSKYLKTLNIFGNIDVQDIIKRDKRVNIHVYVNTIYLKIKKIFYKSFEKQNASILCGIVLGDTIGINNYIKEKFSDSNIAHTLAISGMHIGYITGFCTFFIIIFGKRKGYFITIFVLLVYISIIGFHPSAIRASIMAILMLCSKIIYKKSDIWTNISFSCLILLLYNPYLIMNSGFILSYIGTIGIIVFSHNFKPKSKIIKSIGITVSVFISIFPILAVCFHKIPILNLFISCIIGTIVALCLILGIFFIIFNSLNFKVRFIIDILNILISFFINIAEFGAKIPLGKIYIISPSMFFIIIYYFIVILVFFRYKLYHTKSRTFFTRRIRNLISLLKYKIKSNKKRCISLAVLIIISFTIIRAIPNNLKIYFVDVGQGDSCLIITPENKKILLDGGGSTSENNDVGKNVLIPYLLNRGITKLDYIIVSHFDTDHVGGLLTVMEKLKVDKVIISKQGENSANLEKFKEIISKKNTNVKVVGKGDRVQIEKNLYLDILWPDNQNLISDNILNNNSIVVKLNYKSFSMLFTGDIEEIAEKEILKQYKNNLNVLNSTILKVAHHGSKTSSTQEFLDAVKAKIALIGVGENNKFGHPNEEVIKMLRDMRTRIYRTDKMGEITMIIDKNGIIRANIHIKCNYK